MTDSRSFTTSLKSRFPHGAILPDPIPPLPSNTQSMSTMLIRMIAVMCLGFYILLDDAGYGDLSSYGQTKFQTPHIDRLAKEGLKFTDHYSASTVYAPTRCSLMTGLHTGRCYIRDNNEVRPEGQGPMPVAIPHAAMQAPEDSVAPFRKRFARLEETSSSKIGNRIIDFA